MNHSKTTFQRMEQDIITLPFCNRVRPTVINSVSSLHT
ncbi:Hypothetical protein CpP54B96_1167 [Corynebacterium pseudotuberculosis P54B96]|nr:Hypothetical protein CpPAT10_1144a [Corynebacterium pseudotuberculosis PAT10]AFF22304.1 Hypothetical protein CpP54B96_1167 [Corynebacterium pseudotuberculosis P54B96]